MTIHSAEDVKEVIETETNLIYDIKVHTAEEIKQVRDNLPKLGPLNKAMKIDEILIISDGDVKSKFLPLMSSMRVSKSKSPGCIERSRLVRKATRMSKMLQYNKVVILMSQICNMSQWAQTIFIF